MKTVRNAECPAIRSRTGKLRLYRRDRHGRLFRVQARSGQATIPVCPMRRGSMVVGRRHHTHGAFRSISSRNAKPASDHGATSRGIDGLGPPRPGGRCVLSTPPQMDTCWRLRGGCSATDPLFVAAATDDHPVALMPMADLCARLDLLGTLRSPMLFGDSGRDPSLPGGAGAPLPSRSVSDRRSGVFLPRPFSPAAAVCAAPPCFGPRLGRRDQFHSSDYAEIRAAGFLGAASRAFFRSAFSARSRAFHRVAL